ncbi:MAG: phosphoribosylanthranilate isomerase [Burkholderiales bacterium]|jgi:phosphoribosylanthranilate isomerase|nr:phosphoribosylanthranilate isomerase [Burkholderiales bacterium]
MVDAPAFVQLRTRIKLCGLKSLEDVNLAVMLGADALGFVFYDKSPRAVTPLQAALWLKTVAPWVTPVGLFVNPGEQCVENCLKAIPNLTLQFHADETNEFCRQFGAPFFKAARMQSGLDLNAFCNDFPDASAILVDAFVEGYGGGGHAFDWTLLPDTAKFAKPLILSGGLNPDNVGLAISKVRPYAVDVSSGIEVSRGEKSPAKMQAFCKAVVSADRNLNEQAL